MKTKVLFLLLATLFLSSSTLYAQKFTLGEQDIKVLKERAAEKVGMMNKYIAFIKKKKNDSDTRFYYKEEAQKLFVNDCNPFTEIVEFEDGSRETIRRESVTMQVASLRNKTPRTKPMKEYFRGLIKMNYKSVKMESTDIADMRVSKLQPYGKDADGKQLYVCSVFFDQVFVGVTPEGRKYQDITHKWVVCYVQVDKVYDPETGDTYNEYMVRLGDVHVESIEKLW